MFGTTRQNNEQELSFFYLFLSSVQPSLIYLTKQGIDFTMLTIFMKLM